ncbi:hypothetical protein [Halomonas heilongjiangensis]|uniref:Alpha-L-glutamate ligase-related protein ATP-grasp domain-containing protein n=1 Tax=Halomonas heilongjiangensis TaxID=1387883 RepID=A0A2N7TRF3_9GAMM|nr:hypothetical protein [Halomonas heilongjiangensis]PMR70759.1 hypothetical protein C1H66_05650 [Halomonas heilongjiangensis]PXX93979.1 hypothetical protein CR158_03060 [Halomonas heilongjiangensis]
MPNPVLDAAKRRLLRVVGHRPTLLREEILRSGYFNAEWYLGNHPELQQDPQAQRDPLGHFMSLGARQGLSPGPGFHTAWYLEEYEDVRGAGINPLIHYLRYGRHEERRPTPHLAGIRERLPYLRGGRHSRIIYDTKRSADLSHEGRVQRLDKAEGVEIWREFSRDFLLGSRWLAQEDAEYLHNRGFLPDKKALYRLPNAQADAYVSDLQARLLPLTNGNARQLLETPALQYQLFARRLPMRSPRAAAVSTSRLKVLMMLDPASAALIPLAAVVERTECPLGRHSAKSYRLSLNTGRVKSVVRYRADTLLTGPRLPRPWERGRYQETWRFIEREILAVITHKPIFTFAQIDIEIGGDTPRLIELSSQPSVVPFQVHGPLMQSEAAVEFIREFGI